MTSSGWVFDIAMAVTNCLMAAGTSLLSMIVFAWILRAIGRTGLWGGPANRSDRPQPGPSDPESGKGTRRVETLILLAIGVMGLLGAGAYGMEGEPLLVLGQLHPAFAMAHLAIFGAALTLIVASAAVALGGRSKSAFFLIVFVVGMYQGANGSSFAWEEPLLVELLIPAGASDTVVDLSFEMEDDQEGVDLWANGIHLGTTPLTIPWAEFQEKVPAWPEPPGDWHDKTDRHWARLTPIVIHTDKSTTGKGLRRHSRKMETVPGDGYYVALQRPGEARALMPKYTEDPRDYGRRYYKRVVYRLRSDSRPSTTAKTGDMYEPTGRSYVYPLFAHLVHTSTHEETATP